MGLEDMRDEADQAAAFINREIDGDVSSSAAGSREEGREGKKRERARVRSSESLAARPTQRIDDWQHVDYAAPFIHRTYGVKNHYSERVRGNNGTVRQTEGFFLNGLSGVCGAVYTMQGFFLGNDNCGFHKVVPIMCALRSCWAHLAPDSFSSDA